MRFFSQDLCHYQCQKHVTRYSTSFTNVTHEQLYIYSRLSLSRLRLSRITAYFEVKIWSLFWHKIQTTGNKILRKRGEIAPEEQFLLFSTIFSNISLSSGVKLHIHLWNVVVRFILPHFCKSDMSRYELFQRVEITRVDYIRKRNHITKIGIRGQAGSAQPVQLCSLTCIMTFISLADSAVYEPAHDKTYTSLKHTYIIFTPLTPLLCSKTGV